jgi:hypothetical protein
VVIDEVEDGVEHQVACVGDSSGLDAGVGDGDVRVEATGRAGDGVDRDRRVVVEAVLVAVGADAVVDAGGLVVSASSTSGVSGSSSPSRNRSLVGPSLDP